MLSEMPSIKTEVWYDPADKRKQKHLRYMHPYVSCGVICNSQDMEAASVPLVDEWIKKMWYINIFNGKLLSHHKEWNLSTCNNMDGPRRYYPKKLFKSGKDKYYMIPFICGILKKKKTSKHNKTETEFSIQRTNRWLPEGRDWGWRKETGEDNEEVQTPVRK